MSSANWGQGDWSVSFIFFFTAWMDNDTSRRQMEL
jgi:hypothetical protein